MTVFDLSNCVATAFSNCVATALEDIQRDSYIKPSLPEFITWMHGHTSPKQRYLLNLICGGIGSKCNYLEIGVFYGASLLSASYRNAGSYTGVDDFSYGTGQGFKNNLFHTRLLNVTLLEEDFRTLDIKKLPERVNVFYFDANWSDEASSLGLKKVAPRLDDSFILIVDNWSRKAVRENTYKAIDELGMYTYSSWQLISAKDCDIDGWWNGWLVAVVQKKPLPETTVLREIGEDEIPLWDIRQRQLKKLITIEDYGEVK